MLFEQLFWAMSYLLGIVQKKKVGRCFVRYKLKGPREFNLKEKICHFSNDTLSDMKAFCLSIETVLVHSQKGIQ